MARTVGSAFDEFLKKTVRLDKDRSDLAKSSKNSLITQISNFPDDGIFPLLHPDISIDYGSFSRKTKIRPLDDIDIMVILHAQGSNRVDSLEHIEIHVNPGAKTLLPLCNDGTYILNSIKVINKFKEYIKGVRMYSKAEIKRNQEALTLNLSSYEWVYDLVPSFVALDFNSSTFYLIPDGKGNWKKTDPRIDKQRTESIKSLQDISVLDVIRIFKFWTKRSTMPTMKSYYLENLILNYYDTKTSSNSIRVEILNILAHIHHNVGLPLNDPKGFQGDINHLTVEERDKIKNKAAEDYHKTKKANAAEENGNIKESIEIWTEIFGGNFPKYF